MTSLVPRAVALRQKSNNQKLTIHSNSQLENIDRPCLEQLPLSTEVSTINETCGLIKPVQLEGDVHTATRMLSEQTPGLRQSAQFKNELSYSSRDNHPAQSDQQYCVKPIYKSSRTYSSAHCDQKRNKQVYLFPIGCIVWLTGLPEVKFNKLQVLKLISIIFKIDETEDKIVLEESISEKKINKVVKYVDLQKGLDNCHIRFFNNKTSQQFLSCLRNFLKLSCSEVLLEKDQTIYNFSNLKATLLNGRREEIYWEKIPLYLYH